MTSTLSRLGPVLPLLLFVLGLLLLTAAAWTVHPGLGLAVGGLACFVAEWRIAD